ncbi:MAG: biotin/lipoyl-binding protein, partial [Candidatus Omnitrophota bacterium]|nr:biotin/lipoyl-binding protein [Candidatus Omnitrophota bacterium]
MRKWGIVIAAAVLIILAGGLVAQQRGRSAAPAGQPQAAPAEPDAVAVEAAPAALGSIEQTLDLTGTIVSSRRVELTPKIPGKIAAIYVQEGARVSGGQAIAALDASDQAAQVTQAEQGVRQAAAAREVAQARLAALQSGARSQERALAETAVAQAEANLRSAERNVTRMQQLFESGAVSRQQLDDAILQRDVMRSALDSARQQLSLVQVGARQEDLRMARAQVEQ